LDALTLQTIKQLKAHRGELTRQQIQTLKGQALAGNAAGALRGLQKILEGGGKSGTKK
jgi:hypothetical protein